MLEENTAGALHQITPKSVCRIILGVWEQAAKIIWLRWSIQKRNWLFTKPSNLLFVVKTLTWNSSAVTNNFTDLFIFFYSITVCAFPHWLVLTKCWLGSLLTISGPRGPTEHQYSTGISSADPPLCSLLFAVQVYRNARKGDLSLFRNMRTKP